jgi:hypothetical protein
MYLLAPKYQAGREVDAGAEAAERAYAECDREREETAFGREEVEAPPVEDDGPDQRDVADEFCLAFASPSVGERDPSQTYHDRYAGTVWDR